MKLKIIFVQLIISLQVQLDLVKRLRMHSWICERIVQRQATMQQANNACDNYNLENSKKAQQPQSEKKQVCDSA